AVVAAPGGQDSLLLREAVAQTEAPGVGQQGARPTVVLARRLQVAALAAQVPLLLQDVGEQPLELRLLSDLARVGEERGGAGVVASESREARQVQVGGALLGAEARVLRTRQDAETLRGAAEVAGHGVVHAEVVGGQ